MTTEAVLKTLIASAILMSMVGCTTCDDCNEPKVSYQYINNSSFGLEINLVSKQKDTIALPGYISKNDTMTYFGTNPGILSLNQNDYYSGSRVEIVFDSSPQKCLIFSGVVLDSTIDIRHRRSYRGQGIPFYYTLTDSLYNKAGDCP